MTQLRTSLFLVALVGASSVLLNLNGCSGASGGGRPPGQKIQHVVVIVQENRTPDNLFQDPVLISRRADIVQSGLNSKGHTIPLAQGDLASDYDLNHTHEAWEKTYDGGKMDGADLIFVKCNPGATKCPPPNAEYWYVNPSQVQPYFQLAEQYTFGDRMFQTQQGPSFPAPRLRLPPATCSRRRILTYRLPTIPAASQLRGSRSL